MKLILYFLLLLNCFTLLGQCPPSDLVLTTQTEVNDFPTNYPGCTVLPVNLTIESGPSDQISDLSPLAQLTSVDGSFIINANPVLTGLSGLENITAVNGDLRVSSNDLLVTITGLTNLTSVAGDLEISGNPVLTGVEALSDVTAINGELRVVSNDALTTLIGLDNIDQSTITNLVIESSSALALCSVPSICGYLLGPGTRSITGNATGCSNETEVSAICIGGLPVELMDFAGVQAGFSNVLSWKTMSEYDNTGFEVQRSRDLVNWEKIAFVPGHGSSFQLHIYTYDDQTPYSGVGYYQLRQIDINGYALYSDVISVTREQETAEVLYPNPTSGKAYVAETDDKSIIITDQQGRHMKTVQGPEIDLTELPQGIYFIDIRDNATALRFRIVRE